MAAFRPGPSHEWQSGRGLGQGRELRQKGSAWFSVLSCMTLTLRRHGCSRMPPKVSRSTQPGMLTAHARLCAHATSREANHSVMVPVRQPTARVPGFTE